MTAQSPKSNLPEHGTDRDPAEPRVELARAVHKFLQTYAWLILKNVIGWLLIMLSWPVGLAVPGPGGIPMFLIGFGLITFPGKRHLTARVLRGRAIDRTGRYFRRGVALVAVVLPTLVMAYLFWADYLRTPYSARHGLVLFGAYMAGVTICFVCGLYSDRVFNRLILVAPLARRKIRPWLRRKGIDLLPPRRRRRRLIAGGPMSREPDSEILEIDPRYGHRARHVWKRSLPWLKRALGVAITVAIFAYILRPVVRQWDQVRADVLKTDPSIFIIASAMFAAFLFLFRVVSWRRMLKGLGHKLPVAAATRIWSTSELARYLPGAIWQVVGRVYLVKPYGVSGSVCSTSQILELTVYLLANLLVAVGCLLWFGARPSSGLGHDARMWLFVAMGLVPLLTLLLHPRIFYGIVNRVMHAIQKPAITQRPRGYKLFGLLGWAVVGLAWQSVAVFLLVRGPLELEWSKLWAVAGSYCLAWCAGFLAFWAPGGLGVRELVFMTAMMLFLPQSVREHFTNPEALVGLLAFLSVLLRLWTVAGELLLASLAYAFDFRGAIGRVDAPGRIVAS